MGNHKKNEEKSRRQFFLSFFSEPRKTEKVKLLTQDGKLVEVEKTVFEVAANKKKASNKDIYNWMKNPSKDTE